MIDKWSGYLLREPLTPHVFQKIFERMFVVLKHGNRIVCEKQEAEQWRSMKHCVVLENNYSPLLLTTTVLQAAWLIFLVFFIK